MALVTVSETPVIDDGGLSLQALAGVVAPAAAPALDVVEPVTLAEAKEHLRVFIADDDAYISGLIVAARAMAEGKLNRTIVQRRREARFLGWGDRMRLLKPPIISVDSISYYDETGAEMILDSAGYYLELDDEEGVAHVKLLGGEPHPLLDTRRFSPITVRFTAGYTPGQVPATVVQWIKLAIGTMYGNRETIVNGTTSQPLGDDFCRWLLQPHMVYE